MLGNPSEQRREFRSREFLRRQMGAELRLAAGAHQIHHMAAGDSERHGIAEILAHQGQRQIHARSNAGRGPDLARAHEQRVALQRHIGKQFREQIHRAPMGGGALALEQTDGGEEERARTDRDDTAGTPGALRKAPSSAGSRKAVSISPPAIISVSIFAGRSAQAPSATSCMPLEVSNGPAFRARMLSA